jgi:hypothetical protein
LLIWLSMVMNQITEKCWRLRKWRLKNKNLSRLFFEDLTALAVKQEIL